jgi:hypothetical protein
VIRIPTKLLFQKCPQVNVDDINLGGRGVLSRGLLALDLLPKDERVLFLLFFLVGCLEDFAVVLNDLASFWISPVDDELYSRFRLRVVVLPQSQTSQTKISSI